MYGSALGGSGSTFGRNANKEELVRRVKDWQRKGEGHKQAWYKYCSDMGTTNFDPNRFEEPPLRTFLAAIEAGRVEVDANAVPLPGHNKGHKLGGVPAAFESGGFHLQAWGSGEGLSRALAAATACSEAPIAAAESTLPRGGASAWDMMQMLWDVWCAKGGRKGGVGGGGCGTSARCGGSASSMDGSAGGGRRAPKPGEWSCPSCGNDNWSNREQCNRCFAPRGQATPPRGGTTQDDWSCAACGDLVSASRSTCKLCSAPRPGGLDHATGDVSTAASGAHRFAPY